MTTDLEAEEIKQEQPMTVDLAKGVNDDCESDIKNCRRCHIWWKEALVTHRSVDRDGK